MSTPTKNWTVETMGVRPQLNGLENVVATVSYVVTTTQSENGVDYSARTYGTVQVDHPESGGFVPFSELTEDVVVGWVKDRIGSERVRAIEDKLDLDIAAQVVPTIVTPPNPWQQVRASEVISAPAEDQESQN